MPVTDDLWQPGWDDDPSVPPDPLPLEIAAIERPEPFPTQVLPPVFANMVRAVAANKQVPEDLPALFGMCCIGALAGPRIAVSRGHGWTEPLNLYGAVVMESGTGKTPAAKDVIRPLRRIQKRMRSDHVDAVDVRIDELVAKRGETKDPARANALEDAIKELEASKGRPPRIMFGSDTTTESLSDLMSRNNGHGSILDPEGEFFGILSGRYTKQIPNLGLALKAYDGDYYEVGRIGRSQDDIERAILSLGFGVQETVIEAAAKDRAMVERGLLARFLFALPPSMLGTRDPEGAPYDHDAMATWADALERIYEIETPDPDEDDFPALRLERAAWKRHVEYCQWIEARLHPDTGDLGTLTGWASKHKGRALRIAGLLHLVHGYAPDLPVSERAMNAAISVCRWAIGHAIAVFGMSGSAAASDDSQCVDVLNWIRRTQPARFTGRDAVRGVRRNWVTGASMAQALDRLAALGQILVKHERDRANRPVLMFVPHPSLLLGEVRDAA